MQWRFFIVFMLIVARILLFHTDSVLFFHSACWFNWTVTTPATSRDCIGLSIPPFYGDRPSPSLSFRVGGWVVHAGYADLLNSFFPFNQRNLRENILRMERWFRCLNSPHHKQQIQLLLAGFVVEHSGLEPLTSTLPVLRSTRWASAPWLSFTMQS